MGRRLEMPPQCARCRREHPQYGKFCKKCIVHAAWLEAIQKAWDPDQVRVGGELYVVQPEPKPDPVHLEPTGGRGMGGQEFRIRFQDRRIITTRNLWSIGKIPAEYREALPDNAEFIRGRRSHKKAVK